ncbi:MAG: S-malonyltransferase, partial [Pseudomonadota bacterium]
VVIAGHKAAVERTMEAAKAMGAKRAILLPISVPVHCSLMRPAADNMALRLAEVSFQVPKVPILHNVGISAKTEASEIREALAAQIYHPVRWVETINAIAAQAVETVVECGAGKVLVGLNKRIVKSMNTYNLSDVAGLEAAIKAME